MKRILLYLWIALMSISLTFWSVLACSCIPPSHPLESVDSSTSVFLWTVNKIESVTRTTEYWDIEENKVEFNVLYNVKWTEWKTQAITTSKDSAACGFNFEEWKDYIVYAYEVSENQLWVSLCSRTALLENATEDIQSLNIDISTLWNTDNTVTSSWDTLPPVVDDSIDVNSNNNNIYLILWIIVLAIALIVIWVKVMK